MKANSCNSQLRLKLGIVQQTVMGWLLFTLSSINFCAAQNARGAEAIVEIGVNEKPGEIYALVIGISDYKNIDDLNYADLDAIAFSNYLRSIKVPEDHLIEFYNQDATKANIVEKGFGAIDLMVSRNIIKEKDIVIVYMAGHGGAYNVTDSYFFPYDALTMQDGGTSVSIFDIKSDLGKWAHKNRNVILVFDACRSATISGLPTDAIKMVSKLLEEPNGSILFAASSGGKEALEFKDLKHGVFTYYFLKGLYGDADIDKNNTVTIKELGDYVYNNVKTKSEQKPKMDLANQEELALAQVEKALMASAEKDIANAKEIALSFSSRGKSAITSSTVITDLEKKFSEALKARKLIRPINGCAYYYYKEIEKMSPDAPSTLNLRTSLAASLYEASRTVLENDLKGLRLYLKTNKTDTDKGKSETSKTDTLKKSNGYNLTYYADALTCLDRYLTLKDDKQNVNAEKLRFYFTGRQNWIKYQTEDDSVKWRKHLDESIAEFEAAVKKFPNEPYLLEGYAISLGELASESKLPSDVAKVKAVNDKVIKLAPKWSYPYTTMGDLYYFLDDLKEAEKWNAQALKLSAKDPYVYLKIGDVFLDREEYDKAIGYYLKAYQMDTALTLSLESLGDASFENKDVKMGIFYFEKLMKLDPTYVNAMNDYADYLEDFDSTNRAKMIYKKSLAIDPQNDYALYSLAAIYYDEDENEKALDLIKKACEINNDYDNRFLMGQIYRDLGDYGNSKKLFEALVEEFPDKPGPLNELAWVYRKQENYPKAIEYYRQAYAKKPKTVYLRNLSYVFDDMKLADSVIAINKKIIRLEPKEATHHNTFGNVYYRLKKYPEALVEYQLAARMDAKMHVAFYNQGLCYQNIKDYANAIKCWSKTLEINPKYKNAYDQLGEIHSSKLGLPDDAIKFHLKSIELDKEDAWSYYEIGYIYSFFLKDLAKSKEYMLKAIPLYEARLKKDPKSVNTLTSLADCYYRFGDYKTAIEYLDKANKLNPKDSYTHSKRGYIYLRQKNFDGAQKEFSKALELDPKNSNRPFGLACFFAVKGQNKEALEWLKKAFDMGYSSFVSLKFDSDLDSIRETEEFKQMVNTYNK